LSVERSDGTEVYSTPDNYPPGFTSANPANLPFFTPLTGELDFAHIAISHGVDIPTVAAGRGFAVRFPLQCVATPPAIVLQPQSQVVALGDALHLNALFTGQVPLTYQWKKDGVPIAGATGATQDPNGSAAQQFSAPFSLTHVQATDAG